MLHAYRMRSLFGESRIVDDPCLNRSVPCHGRQHHLAHLDQHLLIRPVRDADKMQQRLVLRCRPRRSRPGGHRFHTLALARQYQTRAIVAQRANPIRVPEHARKPRYICRKSNFACPFASRIHVSTSAPNPESSQIVDSRSRSVRPSDSVRIAHAASEDWRAWQDSNLRPDCNAPETLSGQSCDPAEIEPLDDVVASQFVDRIGRDDDLTMDDDVTAIGDPYRLIEVLLRHQHRQAEMLI